MFKSKLQEFCQKTRTMSLPVYTMSKEGPPHDLRFEATVIVDDMQFRSHIPWKTAKDAQNDAARIAFSYLTAPLPPPPPFGNDRVVSHGHESPGGEKRRADVSFTGTFRQETKEANQTPLIVAPPIFKDDNKIGGSSDVSFTGTLKPEKKEANQTPSDGALPFVEDDRDFEGGKHLYKNRLQSLAQKRNLTLPIYFCKRVGPPHASRFRCEVRVGTQTFETQEFFPSTKEAEHAAAKVALMSLPLDGIQEDDTIIYKNLLQELCQKQGCPLPAYATTKSGELHSPVFISTVEVEDNFFTGEESRTKKQAEMSAAKVAYRALREVTSISDYSPKVEATNNHQMTTKDGNCDTVDDSGNQLLAEKTADSAGQLPLRDSTAFTSHVVVFPCARNMSLPSDGNFVTSDGYWVAKELKAESTQ